MTKFVNVVKIIFTCYTKSTSRNRRQKLGASATAVKSFSPSTVDDKEGGTMVQRLKYYAGARENKL